MLTKIVIAFVMIVTVIALYPMINTTIKAASMNITSTPSEISEPMIQILSFVPIVFLISVGLIIIFIIWSALKDGKLGLVGEKELEKLEEEEEEKEEEKEEKKIKKHSTIITTKKKDGNVKTNIQLGPGYNVDKYELDKPSENKLTYKEKDFGKTRFD